MSRLLRLLLSFLYLGAEPDEPAAGAPEGDDAPDIEDDEPAPAASGDDAGDGGDGNIDPPQESAGDKRARELQEEVNREREGRIRAEERARVATPSPTTSRDPEYEREEEQLRAAQADPNRSATDNQWLRWQVDQNRRTRASERTSAQALAKAQDISDRTDFASIKADKPKAYAKYAPQVEKAVADMRAQGQEPLSRRVLFALMIGKDFIDGKLKPKATKSAPAGTTPGRVDRGRTPGVRTDVSGRRTSNESQARRERLKGVAI